MTKWIVPCNLTYYDAVNAFRELKKVDWKQSSRYMAVDDIIYIYVGKPISAIKYKCIITKTDLSTREIDDSKFIIDGSNYEKFGRYMELKMVREFEDDLITLDTMSKNGISGNIQGPRRVNEVFARFLSALQEDK